MKKLISVIMFCLFTVSTFAAEININADGTGDYPTIQAAINASADGDVIILQPGYYIGEGNRDIDFLGKAITVRSTDPNNDYIVENTAIEGEFEARAFIFHCGEGLNSVVDGIAFEMCDADNGGAIYCDSSSPTISKCQIWYAQASENGGGIYLNNSNASINDCAILGSTAESSGGGIYLNNSNAYIIDCWISSNTAGPFGGGIYGSNNSCPTIDGCRISYNSADSGGGIYFRDNCNATISRCLIYENSCIGYRSSIISGGSSGGGGVSCRESTAVITNCSICYNVCEDTIGGGIYARGYGAEINISNSILWANECGISTGDQIACGLAPGSVGSFVGVAYCDVEGGQADTYSAGGIVEWSHGNIDADPYFANVSSGDFHLKSTAGRWSSNHWVTDAVTSPCIDAGNPGCMLGDEPSPNGNRINMGAFGGTAEASMSPDNFRSLSDLNNDWNVDFNDLAIFAEYWLNSGMCMPPDFDRSSLVDFTDYAIFTYDQ